MEPGFHLQRLRMDRRIRRQPQRHQLSSPLCRRRRRRRGRVQLRGNTARQLSRGPAFRRSVGGDPQHRRPRIRRLRRRQLRGGQGRGGQLERPRPLRPLGASALRRRLPDPEGRPEARKEGRGQGEQDGQGLEGVRREARGKEEGRGKRGQAQEERESVIRRRDRALRRGDAALRRGESGARQRSDGSHGRRKGVALKRG